MLPRPHETLTVGPWENENVLIFSSLRALFAQNYMKYEPQRPHVTVQIALEQARKGDFREGARRDEETIKSPREKCFPFMSLDKDFSFRFRLIMRY
jgi:hypothetical protein